MDRIIIWTNPILPKLNISDDVILIGDNDNLRGRVGKVMYYSSNPGYCYVKLTNKSIVHRNMEQLSKY